MTAASTTSGCVARTASSRWRERLSHPPRRDARAAPCRGPRDGSAPMAEATCPRSSTWLGRSSGGSLRATKGGRGLVLTAWNDIDEAFCSAVARVEEAGRLAPGWTGRARRPTGPPDARSHDSTWKHNVADRWWPGRMTYVERRWPRSRARSSPRDRNGNDDRGGAHTRVGAVPSPAQMSPGPRPDRVPAETGSGPPGSGGKAFGRSSQEETVGR